MAFVGDPSAAVVGAIAFAALFGSASQVSPKPPASGAILPNIQIDRFMAESALIVASQVPGNLFGAPALAEQPPDEGVVLLGVVAIAPRATASAVGALLGFARPVSTVRAPAAIAGQLTGDGAAVAPQLAGNLRGIQRLLSKVRDNIPVMGGDLLIRHYGSSLLRRREKLGVSQIASLFPDCVALSL